MTTHSPRTPYSPEELKTLYPKELELRHVQVIFRHGERTPTAQRLRNAGVEPFWPYCNSAKYFTAAVLNQKEEWDGLRFNRMIETFGKMGEASIAAGKKGVTSGMCLQGQLTDKGRQTTLSLGERLRNLYVHQLNFLPEFLSDANSTVFLRMTPIPRAGESLQQVFTGLWPSNYRTPDDVPIIHTRNPQDENLFPNDANCRRFNMLARAFAKLAADTWRDTPEMEYLNQKLGKWMPEGQKVAVDGHPRLSGLFDTVNAIRAHGDSKDIPPEFTDPQTLEIMNKINVDEWFRGYGQSEEYRRLGVGSLLGDLKDHAMKMVETDGKDTHKLALYGCHDTTLAGLLATLGAFDNQWPPFTSSIAIETFRVNSGQNIFQRMFSSKEDGWYVRMRYNDKPVIISACKKPGNHLEGDETFCTMRAFRKTCEKLAPTNWKNECLANMDQPGIPPIQPLE